MTFMGQHTAAELRDLLKAQDYSLMQISKAYAAFGPLWEERDPAEKADWLAEWKALNERYAEAKDFAQRSFTLSKAAHVDEDMFPAEGSYQKILRALTAQTDGSYSKGDVQDLHTRLVQAQGKPVNFSRMPQPKPGSDVDLNIYKGADDLIKQGKRAAPYFEIAGLALAAVGVGVAVLYGQAMLPHRR